MSPLIHLLLFVYNFIYLVKDIYYMAADKKEHALAEVAKRKADEIHERTMASDVGYEDYDDDSTSSRFDDDIYDEDDTFSSDDAYYADVVPPALPPRAPATRDPVEVMTREPPPPPPEFAYPPLDGRFQSPRSSPAKQPHGYV